MSRICRLTSAVVCFRMWLIAFLVLCQGAFFVVDGLDCMLETLKCSRLRTEIEPHKRLLESSDALDALCEQQENFYKCLENAMSYCQGAVNVETFPPELLHSWLLTQELCSEGSAWRKRYLETARCINAQHTDFCTSPDFLASISSSDAVPLNRRLLREKAINCIAVTLVMNCGIDAGNVFHYLLKISDYTGSYESLGSEVIRSCHTSENKTKNLNEIYADLLKRIGDIPEQENGLGSRFVLDRVGDSQEEFVSEAIRNALDSLDDAELNASSLQVGDYAVAESETEKIELVTNLREDGVESLSISDRVGDEYYESEVVSLGSLDENYEPGDSSVDYHTMSQESRTVPIVYIDTGFTEYREYEIPGRIAVIGLSFYNHPDGRTLIYWRSNVDDYQSMVCNHIRIPIWYNKGSTSFVCSFEYRFPRPKSCFADYMERETQAFFDPLEIDPEFGAKFYNMPQIDKYVFKQWVHKSEYNTDQLSTPVTYPNYGENAGSEMAGAPDISNLGELEPEVSYEQKEDILNEFNNVGTRMSDGSLLYSTSTDFKAVHKPSNLDSPGAARISAKPLEQVVRNVSLETDYGFQNSVTLDSENDQTSTEEEFKNSTLGSIFETEITLASELLKAVTAAQERKSNGPSKTRGLPEDIWSEIQDLLLDLVLKSDPRKKINSTHMDIYFFGREMSPIESVSCGLVNECNPQAKDVVKCAITPRKSKPCNNCKSGETDFSTCQDERELTVESKAKDSSSEDESALAENASPEQPTTIYYLSDMETTQDDNEVINIDPSLLSTETLVEGDGYVQIRIPIKQVSESSDLQSELGISTEVQMLLSEEEPGS